MVNTCGFIEAAKTESIDTILELAAQKSDAARLVVTGCLSQRYSTELAAEMPEIDHFLGSSDMLALRDVLEEECSPETHPLILFVSVEGHPVHEAFVVD